MVVTLHWSRSYRSARVHLFKAGESMTLCGAVASYAIRHEEPRPECKRCLALARRDRLAVPAK